MFHILVQKPQNSSILCSPFFIKYSSLVFAKQDDTGTVQQAAKELMKVQFSVNQSNYLSRHRSGNIKLVRENSSRNIQVTPIVFCILHADFAATIHFNIYLIPLK